MQEHGEMGWCFPVRKLHRESNSCSVIPLLLGIWRDSAPGLVGVFVSCIMGSNYQLVWLLTSSLSQPEWLVLLMFSPIKEVLGCFLSTSTLLPFLSPSLLPFSPSGVFLPELSLQMRAEISAFRFHSTPKVSPRSRASPAAWWRMGMILRALQAFMGLENILVDSWIAVYVLWRGIQRPLKCVMCSSTTRFLAEFCGP